VLLQNYKWLDIVFFTSPLTEIASCLYKTYIKSLGYCCTGSCFASFHELINLPSSSRWLGKSDNLPTWNAGKESQFLWLILCQDLRIITIDYRGVQINIITIDYRVVQINLHSLLTSILRWPVSGYTTCSCILFPKSSSFVINHIWISSKNLSY
jgi:hypothetical protein